MQTVLQHLKSNTKITPTCWEYQRCSKRDRYGLIEVSGELKRAHRVSYELFIGEIPKGMMVCHRCDNPPCINPKHLFLGDNATNRRDSVSKRRHSFGEKRPLSKFKEDQIVLIRRLHKEGLTEYRLAEIYKVNQSTIHKIVSNKTWTHVRGD